MADQLAEMRCEIIDELHDEIETLRWQRMVCLAALEYARPFVWKWCHYQGDNPQFFLDTIEPIDGVLRAARSATERDATVSGQGET